MTTWYERLIGFDVRLNEAEPWPVDRRALYLLRQDAIWPYSVDPRCWPSLVGTPVFPRPKWVGPIQDLWDDLTLLREHIRARGTSQPTTLIAVTVHSAGRDHLVKFEDDHAPLESGTGRPVPLDLPNPPERDPKWELLGYDVADVWCTSGLSNCGYDASEQPALRPKWSQRLNEHHLFAELDHAEEFRALTDARVTEHAPFFIYGLWRIDG